MDRDFASRIRAVRRSLGLSQQDFGQMLSVSLPTVNRYEKGHRIPDADFMCTVAETFSCDLLWLMTGEPSTKCPVLSELTANPFLPSSELIEERISLPDLPPGAVAIRHRDDSMSPLIQRGDLVVFVNVPCENGGLAVIKNTEGRALVRIIKKDENRVSFVSTNPECHNQDDGSGMTLVGSVVKLILVFSPGRDT